MTKMSDKQKLKRKLSDISFEGSDAHIALVHKDQGHGANGHHYALVLKGTNFSEEFIEKVQQVRVTMNLPDFLEKFFHVYGSDAQVLARMMGYVEEKEEDEVEDDWYENYIQSRLESFEIMKSAYETNLPDVLSKLSEEEYMSLLNDQLKIEKALEDVEKAKQESAENVDTSVASEVNKQEVSTSIQKQELEKSMSEKKTEVEMIAKSELVSVQKSLDDALVELQKANATIAEFKQKEKEALEKSRFETVKNAVKDEAKAVELFKALKHVEAQEDFDAAVAALSSIVVSVEKSEMFQETGATGESGDEIKESGVAKILKAKQTKAAK